MLVAESLPLLLLDDEAGTSAWVTGRDAALAGALLLDLLAAELLDEADGKLVVTGAEPEAPALAAAWRVLSASEPRKVKHWIDKLPGKLKPIKGTIAQDLVARGVLDERRHKTLGLFGSTRYPELDPGPEQHLRAALRAVLVDGFEPDPNVAALLALVVPLDMIKRVVERDERKAAKARAKEVADRGPVGGAVRAAVQEQITAAIIAGVAAATASTAAGSAS